MNEKSKSAKFHSASRHNVIEAGLPVYTEGMLKWLERQVLGGQPPTFAVGKFSITDPAEDPF